MSRSPLLLRIATVSVLAVSTLGAVSAAPAHAAVLTCAGLPATIVGTGAGGELTGTDGDDVIVGRGGRDYIDGGEGNDVICGNRGADDLQGGGGDDRIYGRRGNDSMGGGPGNDLLSGGRRGTAFVASPGNDLFRGTAADNTLDYEYAPGPVSVDLGAGTASGWGSDTLDFGLANVRVFGSDHSDTLVGSEGSDHLIGYGPNGFGPGEPGDVDTIDGRGGNDVLEAYRGAIAGGGGDDQLHLHELAGSESTLDGGNGDDGVVVDSVSNGFDFAGGAGVDRLHVELSDAGPMGPFSFDMTTGALDAAGTGGGTASGFENLDAGRQPDHGPTSFDIFGTDGPNVIVTHTDVPATVRGLGGDDVISTDGGDDTVYGGTGDDTADAGDGTDTCTSIEHPRDC